MTKQAEPKTFQRADIGGFRYSRNPPDLVGPETPRFVQAPVPGTNSIAATWVNGIDAQSGIALSYAEVSRFGLGVWTRYVVPWPGSDFVFPGLLSSTAYDIRIANVDASANSNVSAYSATQTVSTIGSAADLEPGIVGFAVATVTTDEGTQFSAAVTRTGGGVSSPGIEADWSISGINQGTPSPANGTLSWAAGENGPKSINSTAGQVTSTQQGTIRIVALRQLAGNITPTLGTSSATLTIVSTDVVGIKWNPGFYGATQNITDRTDSKRANQLAEQALVLSSGPNLLGFKARYYTGIFGDTAGVWDFSKITRDLNALRSMSPRKRLMIALAGQVFGSGTAYTQILPAYVYNDPAFGPSPVAGKYGWWTANGATETSLAYWRPAVMDWIISLFQALAATVNSSTGLTYDADPYVEQTCFSELSFGADPGDATYTSGSRVAQYKRLIDAINIAWPTTLHMCNNNFAGSQALSQDLTNYCSTHRTAQGGPDTLAVGQGELTWGQKAALGAAQSDPAFSGPDLRGIVAMCSDTEGPEISNPNRYTMYTPHSFFSVVNNVLRQSHMCITMISRSATDNPIPAYPADGVNTGANPGNWNSFLQVFNGNTLTHIQKPSSLTTSFAQTGAILSGTLLDIYDTNLGAAPPAPLKALSLISNANGDTLFQAGYDFYNEDGTGGRLDFAVDKTVGIGIATTYGAMKHHFVGQPTEGPASASFNHAGFFVPGDPDTLYVSYYVKFAQTSGPALTAPGQLKTSRLGDQHGITLNSTCGLNLYQSDGAKIYQNRFDGVGSVQEEPNWRSVPFSGSANFANLGTHVDFLDGAYHQHESLTVYNSVGSANGTLKMWSAGQLRWTQASMQPRTASGEHIDWVIPSPGITNGYTDDSNGGPNNRNWDVYHSYIWVSTTPKRICLINASTLAAATSRFPVVHGSWVSDHITGTVPARPSGHNWACWIDSDGITNKVWPLQVIP